MEVEGSSDTALKEGIINVLSDEFRRGSNPKFTVEQIVQIVAIACSRPRTERASGDSLDAEGVGG